MPATNVIIYRITNADLTNLNSKQTGIETTADSDLDFKMYGYKDDGGNLFRLLAKDQKAKVTEIKTEDVIVNAGNAIYLCATGQDKTSSGTIKLWINGTGDFEATTI